MRVLRLGGIQMNNMTIASLLCAALAASAVGYVAAQPSPATQGTPPETELTPGDLKFPTELFQSGLVNRGVVSDVFTQTFTYTVGGKLVRRHKRERALPTDSWGRMSGSESVSYLVTGLTSRLGGDEIYVAGIRDNGDCVIERWTYASRKNGWRVDCALPQGGVPIGTPAPAATQSIVVASGGDWEAVTAEDEKLPAATRREIHSSSGGPFYGIAVDPQGRYLLYFDLSDEKLYRIDLKQRPVVPVAIMTGSTHGFKTAGNMQLMDFTGEGRKCLLRPVLSDAADSPEEYLLGTDANNDAVFESWAHHSSAQWDASQYSDWDEWEQFWSL